MGETLHRRKEEFREREVNGEAWLPDNPIKVEKYENNSDIQ